MAKVAVLGAGSWGTALSIVLADNGHRVRLWTYRKEQAEEINETRRNDKYLDVDIPEEIKAYSNLQSAAEDADVILFVVPTKAIREVSRQLNEIIPPSLKLIHASKGIEPVTLKRVSQMIAEELTAYDEEEVVVLSGQIGRAHV